MRGRLKPGHGDWKSGRHVTAHKKKGRAEARPSLSDIRTLLAELDDGAAVLWLANARSGLDHRFVEAAADGRDLAFGNAETDHFRFHRCRTTLGQSLVVG